MVQEQVQKQRRPAPEQVETEPQDQRNPELESNVEDVLADIDDVLEENAQEFVEQYVQQGGE